MYTSFRVQNFRGFRDLRLDDLARINLIAGKNNTGKTALLEAIYIHSGNDEPSTLLRTDQSSVFRLRRDSEEDSTSIIRWNTIFNDFDTRNNIEMIGNIENKQDFQQVLLPEMNRFKLSIIDRSNDPEFVKIIDGFDTIDFNIYDNGDVIELNIDSSSSSTYMLMLNGQVQKSRYENRPVIIRANFLYARQKIDSRVNAKRFSSLRQLQSLSILIDVLKVIEPQLSDLELLFDGKRPLIYADIGLPQAISLTSMGDGINRIASLVLAMSEVSNGVIFIDEIENGLHYSVQPELWKSINRAAKDFNVQVFATTHSLEMIRAAHEAFKDDDPYDFRYHRLDKNTDTGDIEAVTYNQLGMEAIASIDYEVRG